MAIKKIIKAVSLIGFILAIGVIITERQTYCQSGTTFTNRDLMLDMSQAAGVIKKWYKKHEHLPQSPREQVEIVQILYKKSTDYNPNQPLPMPTSDGAYTRLGRFRVEYNLSIQQESNTLILWRRNPPGTWRGNAGTIGIISDGGYRFLLYAVGEDGGPIKSKDNLAIFFTYNLKDGTDTETLF